MWRRLAKIKCGNFYKSKKKNNNVNDSYKPCCRKRITVAHNIVPKTSC